jgi:hypothetical protein
MMHGHINIKLQITSNLTLADTSMELYSVTLPKQRICLPTFLQVAQFCKYMQKYIFTTVVITVSKLIHKYVLKQINPLFLLANLE